MTLHDPALLFGLPEADGAGLGRVRCGACGRELTDVESRLWGLGAGCRRKTGVRVAPRPAERNVEQDTLPGV